MAKVQHLYTGTAGDAPSNLPRGQIAINVTDKLVFASDPSGVTSVISSGASGVQNASSLLGVHIPTNFMPVAQLGPGLTQAQLQTKFTDDGTTATYSNIPIFAMGKLWWTDVLTCPSSPAGIYQVTIDTVNRTARLLSTTTSANSGVVNYQTGVIRLIVYSDSTIYPWFYLPMYSAPGTAGLVRISPTKTFGAIPVSTGFAGANAATYWGA